MPEVMESFHEACCVCLITLTRACFSEQMIASWRSLGSCSVDAVGDIRGFIVETDCCPTKQR